MRAAGVLALALSAGEYEEYQNLWPSLPPPRRLDWPFRAPWSRSSKTLTVHYGVLAPQPEK